jgi:putative FmdB family regulatory protein
MPTYDYRCKTCGHKFEAFQRITDQPLSECPECGKAVERLISTGLAVIFKGSGFYSTDNKKSGTLKEPIKTSAGKEPVQEKPKETSKESAKESSKEPPKEPQKVTA